MARDATFPETEPVPDVQKRGRPLLAFGARAIGSALVIGALSLLARETIRTNPPVPSETTVTVSTTKAELGIAFVPATLLAARPATPVAAGRLRLDRPGEPVRIEPVRSAGEQTLVQGDFPAIEESHLRLTLTRNAANPLPGLFVTLARRAAEGMNLSVIRTGARDRIATKFGAVETLEATLAGPVRRVCTGFVTLEAQPVRIDGWLCAPLGRPPEPRTVACTLDALALDERSDPATNAVFAEAERRRDPACDPIRALSEGAPEGRTGSIVPRRAPVAKKLARE